MTRLAIVVAALVLLLAGTSSALVLCQKRKGPVVVREACRKKERPVDVAALGALGPQGAPGTPGAVGPAGDFPLKLVDTGGTEIGTILFLFPSSVFVEVSHPLLAVPVEFIATRDGFSRNIGGAISSVFYGSADCSGIPFIREQFGATFAQVYGDFAYYSTAPSASRSYNSAEFDPNGAACGGGSTATGRGTCCSVTSDSTSTQAAVRVALADLGFVPPFSAVPR
jgi:hypothetical protein